MKITKCWYEIKEFFVITLGAVLAGAAIFFFMLPSHLAVGSASALAMVLSNYIPLSVSVINLILNVFLLLIGFILIGPGFGIKTVYTSIMVPVSMGVFEIFFPNLESLTVRLIESYWSIMTVAGISNPRPNPPRKSIVRYCPGSTAVCPKSMCRTG